MKKWLLNNKLYFIGALSGAVAGFFYWKFVGCINGTCVITSHPVRSTVYFALMGSLVFSMFKKDQKKITGSKMQN